ncbi:LacI family DNA-binding transcriptional regulator [Deinococcus radiopugnans]|uniref:DNA-binding LacI/PurR family transcriptional regulator n=1 Tax=Deinococcus radiopugnans ATCC 19172 TaxID=585398 RepID=A0A5C4XKZ3_9DEIO|nr:LacI family DNA-binding transcriptional regulator [Deinococcus radiopugnans]MBB6016444.1 DNA-binding LacI/PurR family transcriptional regulator [Deinococcus radiopugnans ATCC 19172]TNM63310.1 LacI family DNA-binding transcriptional regulator [Deinococcus radiopugnans ATCC 19172]
MLPADLPSESSGRVTLRDVARALGVSVATVSNAYNRPDQLSAALRERVLDTARTLGYGGPDPLARSLRRGRTGVIGVVYDAPLEYAFADPAAAQFLGSLAHSLQAASLNLLLLASPSGPQDDPLSPVQSASVDGLIVYSAAQNSDLLRAVLARGLPTVLVDQDHHAQAAGVGIDDAGGAAQAAQHLLELGHTRIGVLCLELGPRQGGGRVGPGREQQVAYHPTAERLRGYRETVNTTTAAGAGPGEAVRLYLTEAERNTVPDGEACALELLRAEPQLTALLCMSDVLAQGALRAAQTLGWPVPQRLSVVGYDDAPGSANLNLTTVWQPTCDKGSRVGQAMLALLGGQKPADVRLPTRLVVRGSTAARPATQAPDGPLFPPS